MRLDYVALSEGEEDCAVEGLIRVLDERMARVRERRAGHQERRPSGRPVWERRVAPGGWDRPSSVFRRKPVPE
jgi:hypothetical protein